MATGWREGVHSDWLPAMFPRRESGRWDQAGMATISRRRTVNDQSIDLESVLRLDCVIPFPRSEVYEAWSNSDLSARWWSPDDHPVIVTEGEFRVGAHYRLGARTPGGGTMFIVGRYHEIKPLERLVFTWALAGTRTAENPRVVTVEFHDHERGTKMIISETGLTGYLDAIATVLQRRSQSPHPMTSGAGSPESASAVEV